MPPLPRQERSRLKRDALLAAALACFEELGYERTGVDEMARRAGVAVGGFYAHFRSKEQVLRVLMQGLIDELAGMDLELSEVPLGAERQAVEALVVQGLEVDLAYAGAYRAWREASLRDQRLGELNQLLEEWSAGRIAGTLSACLRGPGTRADVDVEVTARMLNLLFWRLTETRPEDPDRVARALNHLLRHALFRDGVPGAAQ